LARPIEKGVTNCTPRFKSAEAALRFYFRAEEILCAKGSLKLHPEGQIPDSGVDRREDLLLDFVSVGSCFKNLNPLQLWLLKELYRPRRLYERQRLVGQVCDLGQRRFPRLRWTLQGVGRLKHQMLDELDGAMAYKGLVSPAPGAELPVLPYANSIQQGAAHGITMQVGLKREAVGLVRGVAKAKSEKARDPRHKA